MSARHCFASLSTRISSSSSLTLKRSASVLVSTSSTPVCPSLVRNAAPRRTPRLQARLYSTDQQPSTQQPEASTPTSSAAAAAAAAAAETKATRSRYFVARTRSGSLPVYTDLKGSGPGAYCLTIVRNIDGDLDTFRKDLATFLFTDSANATQAISTKHNQQLLREAFDQVDVKRQSRQLVVKGDYSREIKSWLASLHY
ncbi:hypothetical protein ACM66B_006379 [Microbotryomycetes sp. NB124-2]